MNSRRINGDEDLGVNSTAFRRTIKLAWLYREPLAAQNDFFLPGLSQETQIRIRLFSQVYGRVYSISNLFNFQVREVLEAFGLVTSRIVKATTRQECFD